MTEEHLRHRLLNLQPKANQVILEKLAETHSLMTAASDRISTLEEQVRALKGWQAKVRRQVRGLRGSRDLDHFLEHFK